MTGGTYYGIIAVPATHGDKLELVTLPLGPKHNARSTCSVNSEYVGALWRRCTEDVIRGVVRSINPDKFNMTTGIGASESSRGRKRQSPQEPCKPTQEEALVVSLQSDIENLKRDKKKLLTKLTQRESTITANDITITELKAEIKELKKELKSARAKKPKSIPSKCTRCTTRAQEETTPANNKRSRGGQATTLQQKSRQSDQDIVRVLVAERDKNDRLVLDLTSQLTSTLHKVVENVVQMK